MKKFVLAALSLAFVLGTSLDAQADIVWGAAANMYNGDNNDASFISTNGTLVDAVNGGGTTVTVNGNEFTGLSGTQSDGQNLTSGNFSFFNHNDNGSAFQQGEFGGGTAGVGTLIQSALWRVDSVTLTGLTSGYQYEIQVLANDARGNRHDNFIAAYGDGNTASETASAPVLMNNQFNAGGDAPAGNGDNVGQHIIGTFTATGATQSFGVYGTNSGNIGSLAIGDSRSHVNAIQLRLIAVPEPSSLAVIGVLGMGLVVRRRK